MSLDSMTIFEVIVYKLTKLIILYSILLVWNHHRNKKYLVFPESNISELDWIVSGVYCYVVYLFTIIIK